MGVAGGLALGLSPGAIIIASAVAANDVRIGTNTACPDHLRRAVPTLLNSDIAGIDTVVAEVSGKAALRRMTGRPPSIWSPTSRPGSPNVMGSLPS